MTGALDLAARNDLRASLACGDPDRSAAPHVPAVCLLDGLPHPGRPRRGSLRAHECSLRLRRPLDPPGRGMARRHRSPGAGEDLSPTSRQEARTVADQLWDPHPRRHLLTHQPGRRQPT
jgi:hypothetical protein